MARFANAARVLTLSAILAACAKDKIAPAPPGMPPAEAGPPDDARALCGALGQPCCASSNCNEPLTCTGGACQVVSDVDAAGDAGCGVFVFCGTACADLHSDANNCGECGHSCAGLECQSGICSSTELASQQLDAQRIAVDSSHVYWTNAGDGTVRSVPKAGGPTAMPSTLVSGIAAPFGIAVDATDVYFTSQGTATASFTDGAVYKLPLAPLGDGGASADAGMVLEGGVSIEGGVDGGSPVVALATGRKRPRSLLVDKAHVYWLDYGIAASDGALLQCPLAGCGASPAILAPFDEPYGLAIDATHAYVSSIGDGTVKSIPFTGMGSDLVQGQNEPSGVAVDANNVYWADTQDSVMFSVPKDGGAATSLAVVMGLPQNVVTDGTYVYFTNEQPAANGGAVSRCPVAGCTGVPLPLSPAMPGAIDLAVDDTYIYWLATDGTVMRAPK